MTLNILIAGHTQPFSLQIFKSTIEKWYTTKFGNFPNIKVTIQHLENTDLNAPVKWVEKSIKASEARLVILEANLRNTIGGSEELDTFTSEFFSKYKGVKFILFSGSTYDGNVLVGTKLIKGNVIGVFNNTPPGKPLLEVLNRVEVVRVVDELRGIEEGEHNVPK